MDKSVLVIDTPESCEKCILYNVTYYPDKNKKENICYKHCPLKPLPSEYCTNENTDRWFYGYNKAIRDIAGETE